MRRREFIAGLAGAAVWPGMARGRQGERVRRIGVLSNLRPDDAEIQGRLAVFLHGLAQDSLHS